MSHKSSCIIAMKNISRTLKSTGLILTLLGAAFTQTQAQEAPKVFQATNTASHPYLQLDNPRINNAPGAVLIVTQCGAPSYTNPIGVLFSPVVGDRKWYVYDENFSNIPIGTVFNVMALKAPNAKNFRVISSALNSFDNSTFISAPGLNNNSNAVILSTHLINPCTSTNYYPSNTYFSTNYTGVWFYQNKWNIYNENQNPTDISAYNVANITGEKGAFVQLSTNVIGKACYITGATNSNSIVFATHNYNPKNLGGSVSDHPIGVMYLAGNWIVINTDGVNMSTNEAFNIKIFPGPQ
jgi:hypothetical protein